MTSPDRLAKTSAYAENRLPFSIAVLNMSKEMNIGSLLRTAHAAGARELVLVGEASYNTYAAATAEKWTPVTFVADVAELKTRAEAQGMAIVAIERHPRAVSLFEAEYPPRPMFLLGAEKFGVPEEALALASMIVEIPQWGLVPSLNVAAAGSVVIYDYLAKLCGARTGAAAPRDLAALRDLAEDAS